MPSTSSTHAEEHDGGSIVSIKGLEILETVARTVGPASPQDIGGATGIPPATVTRLLGKLVADGYLERVGRGQYEMGRRLRRLGQAAAPGSSFAYDTPVVFLPCILNVSDQVYEGLHDVLSEAGLECVVHPLTGWPARSSDLARRQVGESPGIVLFSLNQRLENLAEELGWHHEAAVHAGYSSYDVCDTVSWHEQWVYDEMTSRLIERGCRRVVYFNPRTLQDSLSFRMRLRGYLHAMDRHGLEPRILTLDRSGQFTAELNVAIADAVTASGDGEAGIIVSCDEALAPLAALLEALGLPMGDAVQVASVYCEGKLAEFTELRSRLALSVREPWYEVGCAAAQRLLARLRGDRTPPVLTLVPPTIDDQSPSAQDI